MARIREALPMRPRMAATLALIPAVIFGWYVAASLWAADAFSAGFATSSPSTTPVWLSYFWATIVLPGPFAYYYLSVLAIWWGTVRWTAARRLWIAGVTLLLVCGTVFGVRMMMIDHWSGFLILGTLNCLVGPAGLVLIAWACYPRIRTPDTAAVPCPNCSYDLRGQRSCRCPECGAEFSLGELVEPPEKRATAADGG